MIEARMALKDVMGAAVPPEILNDTSSAALYSPSAALYSPIGSIVFPHRQHSELHG